MQFFKNNRKSVDVIDNNTGRVVGSSMTMRGVLAGMSAGLLGLSQQASAAIALTEVQSGITAATTSGETVGGYVIAAVAALIVVGVIIGLVKKL